MLKNKAILRSALSLMVISGMLKVLGYLEKIILAYYYGTGMEVDVFLLVSGIVLSLFVLFREMIEPGFMNVFMRLRNERESAAWAFFNSFARFLLLPVLLVFIAGFVFPARVVDIFAPGFDAAKREMATALVRVSFPAVIFLCMSNLTATVLNSEKRFALSAIGDVVFKACTILFMVLLFPEYGITGACMGIVIGAVAKLLAHLLALWRRVSWNSERTERIHYRSMWSLTWPLVLGMLFSQSNLAVDNIFASYMQDGMIAALSYAKKIAEMPVVVFPYVLSTVVFPYFSSFAIEQDLGRLRKLFYDTMGWIIFIFVPLSVLFFIFSGPITSILLERGAFNAVSTHITAPPLAVYSLGMLSFAIETVIVLVFFSMADTKTPVFIGVACVLINIAVTYLLIGRINYLAIPLALVISKTLKVAVLFLLLERKIGFNRKTGLPFLAKVLAAAICFGLSVAGIKYLLETHHLPILSGKKMMFIFCAFAGTGVYLLTCYWLQLKLLLKKSLQQPYS